MNTPQYFEPRPAGPAHRREITVRLGGVRMKLVTGRGVFSAERLDPGTSILLEHAPAPPGEGTFLDLGCGTGAIAFHLAHSSPAAAVWAIDVNERAVELCSAGAVLNGLSNVHATTPDAVPDELTFDAIWANPPIRIGKAALHEMLLRWLGRLTPHGSAMLVVNKHLGSDSLARWLAEQGYRVVRLSSHKAYRILRVEPTPATPQPSPAPSGQTGERASAPTDEFSPIADPPSARVVEPAAHHPSATP